MTGFAKPHRVNQYGLENRLQFTRRRAYDVKHLRGCGLLLQCLAQLGGALFDLLLKVGIGFLQPRAHVVELVGQTFQFVAGPIEIRWPKSPLPTRAAPVRNAWIGTTMRRARKIPASTAKIDAPGARSRAVEAPGTARRRLP